MLKKNFKVDNNFYQEKNIKKAILEFSNNFDISYDNLNIYIFAEDNHEIIFDEFMNYLIYLEIKK
jgi:hypothetical protein